MKRTEKEGKCVNCAMNTICTFNEKQCQGREGFCPESVKFSAELDMEKMGVTVSETQESVNIIPVIKMEYFDGSKFIIRTDKANYKKILCKLRVKMRSRFLALSLDKQTEIGRSQTMLKRTEENMSEEEYLKITKYKGQR